MTKIFTAVAVMIVVERGLISLNDDISKVVPELAEPEILVGFEEGENGILSLYLLGGYKRSWRRLKCG